MYCETEKMKLKFLTKRVLVENLWSKNLQRDTSC